MLLAELQIHHSRPFAPTRRVALGHLWLPADPPPGAGGMLLGSIVAAGCSALEGDDEALWALDELLDDLIEGRRVVQPRVRYRFQADTHGLDQSTHRLLAGPEGPEVQLDGHGAVLPQVLGAAYAAGQLSARARGPVLALLRRASRWTGGVDHRLIAFLAGEEAAALRHTTGRDVRWAREVLGFPSHTEPARREVQRRFRQLLRDAHPDHGGDHGDASRRIDELTAARRILTGA